MNLRDKGDENWWLNTYNILFSWIEELHLNIGRRNKLIAKSGGSIITVSRIIFTRFLRSKGSLEQKDIQKYGFAAYSIAFKNIIDFSDCIPMASYGVFCCAKLYTYEEIIDAEFEILDELNWTIPNNLSIQNLHDLFV